VTALRVVAPGFLTTVQDLGRPGHAAAGVSASGAADPLALRIGNRLVGNGDGTPGLEMTMLLGSFRFEADVLFALAGADPGARLGDRAVAPWTPHRARAGDTLVGGALRGGARSYLCVRGGIAVPLVFASASTHLMTGLGGLEGRALRAGDRLPVGAPGGSPPHDRAVDPTGLPGYRIGEPFRVTVGPQASWFASEALARFYDAPWQVAEACDRMGIRLSGPSIPLASPRELATEGVLSGAIQIPPGGLPIVLFVEHQTTGGYPKLANVIAADLARLGQLRPRDTVRFEPISLANARASLRAQEEALDALFS
jgi:biotin-dependent carboxylase-like uncharacterized protein